MRKILLAVALVSLLTACGSDPALQLADGRRVVRIGMADNEYSVRTLNVRAGTTVRFSFDNTGKVDHEAVLGDARAQAEHEQEMGAGGGAMEDMGMEADAIRVSPGRSGALTRRFEESDDGLIVGCHEPGHYRDGMRLQVKVNS